MTEPHAFNGASAEDRREEEPEDALIGQPPRRGGLPVAAIVGFVLMVLGTMAILIWFAVRGGHI